MIYKNADRKDLFSILLFRTIFDFVAAVLFLFTNGWKDCKAVLKAHLHFHRNKKKLTRDTGLPANRINKLIYPKSILFRYFIFHKRKFSELDYYSRNKI
jgi:hypothetical protein